MENTALFGGDAEWCGDAVKNSSCSIRAAAVFSYMVVKKCDAEAGTADEEKADEMKADEMKADEVRCQA